MISLVFNAERHKETTLIPTTKKSVIAYIRVSTEEQRDEGFSLNAQKRKIKAFCELHDLRIAKYIQDTGSGKEKDREGHQELLLKIKQKQISGIIVFRLDRLTRSLLNLAELIELFKKDNTQLYSVMENIDASTPIGRFTIKLLGALAELEVDVLGQRTKVGMEEARKKGVHLGRAPLGKKRNNKGKLVQDHQEQAVIQRILQLRALNLSLRKIAQTLQQEGYQTKRGGKWHPQTIKKILESAQ